VTSHLLSNCSKFLLHRRETKRSVAVGHWLFVGEIFRSRRIISTLLLKKKIAAGPLALRWMNYARRVCVVVGRQLCITACETGGGESYRCQCSRKPHVHQPYTPSGYSGDDSGVVIRVAIALPSLNFWLSKRCRKIFISSECKNWG